MFRKLSQFATRTCASTATRAALMAAVVGAIPTAALADHRGYDRRDYGHHDEWRHDDHRGGGYVGIQIGGGTVYDRCPPPAPVCPPPPVCAEERVWVEPVYRTVTDRRWVEPVYRTVCDKVWIEPVTRTEYTREWVPDRYEWRNIDHWANGKRYLSRESVLVEAAHWADVPHTVEITPGRYEDRPRQELVSAGHWENCDRQEVVCAGHWETRPVIVAAPVVVAPPLRHYEQSRVSIGVRFPL
jgi:hypothetical protein